MEGPGFAGPFFYAATREVDLFSSSYCTRLAKRLFFGHPPVCLNILCIGARVETGTNMCNWRAWMLPGFLTLAVLTALAVLARGGSIEADLTARSMMVLGQGGTPWVSATVDGRDVTLTGTAPTEASLAAAITAAQRVQGIYRIDTSRLDLLPLADPYTLTFEKTANTITVTGSFPDGQARVEILDALRTTLGSTMLVDNSHLARGAPIGFLSLADFGAAGLFALESGTITLEGTALSITGNAISSEAYNAELARLGAPPEGLTLGDVGLNPPEISPYTWSAEATASGLTLSGYVPDAETREAILLAAEPFGEVADRMEIGRGATDGFGVVAISLLEQMRGLDNGSASIHGLELSLTGDAATSQAYRAANDFLGSLPSGFDSLSGRITPPVADPFVTTLEKSEDGYVLSGVLPDETARAVLLDALEGQGGPLIDTATVARGAPRGIAIGDLFAQVVPILGDLQEGTATLIDDRLTIAGVTSEGTQAQAFEARIAALAGNALSVVADITVSESEPLTVPREPL